MGKINGARQYERFKNGEKLTRKQAMLAKCYECNGLEESRIDCEVDTCPMFSYRLYPKTEKALSMDSSAKKKAFNKLC